MYIAIAAWPRNGKRLLGSLHALVLPEEGHYNDVPIILTLVSSSDSSGVRESQLTFTGSQNNQESRVPLLVSMQCRRSPPLAASEVLSKATSCSLGLEALLRLSWLQTFGCMFCSWRKGEQCFHVVNVSLLTMCLQRKMSGNTRTLTLEIWAAKQGKSLVCKVVASCAYLVAAGMIRCAGRPQVFFVIR